MDHESVTVREAVLHLLRAFGMRRIFGKPGSTELPLFLDFPADFEYVLGLQESVVVGMADGHASATRNAAFVNLHSAVGVGHAMGAIFTAWKNRTPLLMHTPRLRWRSWALDGNRRFPARRARRGHERRVRRRKSRSL